MVAGNVRYYTSDHPQIHRTVRGALEKRRRELVEQIASGTAQDWGDYNKRTGVIRGIDEALQICIEAETKLNKE